MPTGSLAVIRGVDSAGITARELAGRSCAWDRVLAHTMTDAALTVGEPRHDDDRHEGSAVVLGAFHRPNGDEPFVVRRGSGGLAACVGPGRVWMQLVLSRSSALDSSCTTADKLLNRYVRPLLRAVTIATGVKASYFGRDWISVAHRPAALVAFAHDTSSGRALFEAFIGVRDVFLFHGASHRTFLGKEPATLEEVAGKSIDTSVLVNAIVSAYSKIAETTTEVTSAFDDAAQVAVTTEPEWQATREEVIGEIHAGRDANGRMRIGGDFMASRDAVARLEDAVNVLPASASADDVGRIVDEALTTRGAILFGVRSLASIRDAIVDARALR